jgi:flavin reductase (DIM6/NTAB) family NADH-FMN oxidoreductase RutF
VTTPAVSVDAAALSRIAMPVVLVAAAHDGARSCATATVMYVSLSPVMVALALHPGSRTTALVRASGELSISLLAEGQLDTAIAAGHGATSGDKLTELGLETVRPPDGFGVPGIAGSLSILWCRVGEVLPVGDHVIVLATVEHDVKAPPPAGDAAPLIRYERRYAALGAPILDEPTDRYPV